MKKLRILENIKKDKKYYLLVFSLIVIIILLVVLLIKVMFFGRHDVMYPVIFNNANGEMYLATSSQKKNFIKLSNSDSSENVIYANNTEKYVLFKKNADLYLYDARKKDETKRIAGNVVISKFSLNDKYVVLLDNDNNLYSYEVSKNKDKVKLDNGVSNILVVSSNYVLYIKEGALYLCLLDGKEDKIMISDNYDSDNYALSMIAKNEKNVLFINEKKELILYNIGKKSSKVIAESVSNFIADLNIEKIFIETVDGERKSIFFYEKELKELDEGNITVYDVNIDKKVVLYSKLNDKLYDLYMVSGNYEPVLIEKEIGYISKGLIWDDNEAYYVNQDDVLKYAKCSHSNVNVLVDIAKNVNINSFRKYKDGYLFVNNVDGGNGNLYKASKGVASLIDENVNNNFISVSSNGKEFYYLKDYNKVNGDLYISKGKKGKKIDNNVYSFSYIGKNLIYYIKNYNNSTLSGDLYRYTNKSVKLESDVRRLAPFNYVYK